MISLDKFSSLAYTYSHLFTHFFYSPPPAPRLSAHSLYPVFSKNNSVPNNRMYNLSTIQVSRSIAPERRQL